MSASAVDEERSRAVAAYTQALRSSREIEARAKARRELLREARKKFDKSEDDITALQSVGQQIGEVLKQLDDERFIIKASSGPRYVVGVRRKVSPRYKLSFVESYYTFTTDDFLLTNLQKNCFYLLSSL